MAKHPGATEVLERDPLLAPVLCLPMPVVVVAEGGQQEFGSLACRFNHSLVKRTPPPHPKRTNVVGNDCQMRWLVRACVIFSKAYFIYFLKITSS